MSRLFAGTPFDIPPTCDRCEKPVEDCCCEPLAEKPHYADPSTQTVRVRVDQRKHKRKATVVWGLDPAKTDLADLLTQLKSACGAGGSRQEDQLELQGDHADRVRSELARIGFKVR